MSFTDEILKKYRCAPFGVPPVRTMLAHKIAGARRKAAPRIDAQRQSRELLRLIKPGLEAEGKRIAAGLRLLQKSGASEMQRKLTRDAEAADESRRLELARLSRGLARDKEELFDELKHEHELVVKRGLSRLERGFDSDAGEAEKISPAVLSAFESGLFRRLEQSRLEIVADMRKMARAEAEAALHGFRDEEEYDRLRRGGVWR